WFLLRYPDPVRIRCKDICRIFTPSNRTGIMKHIFALFIALLVVSETSIAQDDLFGIGKQPARKGFIIGVNASFDVPAADMAKRFGNGYRIGGAVDYKTTANWMFGAKVDFMLGNVIREDSFLVNVRDDAGNVINASGE